jgi:hypothetical protein
LGKVDLAAEVVLQGADVGLETVRRDLEPVFAHGARELRREEPGILRRPPADVLSKQELRVPHSASLRIRLLPEHDALVREAAALAG